MKKKASLILCIILISTFMHFPVEAEISSVYLEMKSFLTGCWAACMSSIGMYHTNQSVSIATIRNITGVAGMNSMQNTCSSMQTIFSLYYSRTLNPGFYRMQYQAAILSQPSFLGCGLILSEEEIAGHMMVLRGYACGTSYNALYLMDPAQGYITVSIVAGSLVSFYYCGYLTAVLEMGDRVY